MTRTSGFIGGSSARRAMNCLESAAQADDSHLWLHGALALHARHASRTSHAFPERIETRCRRPTGAGLHAPASSSAPTIVQATKKTSTVTPVAIEYPRQPAHEASARNARASASGAIPSERNAASPARAWAAPVALCVVGS